MDPSLQSITIDMVHNNNQVHHMSALTEYAYRTSLQTKLYPEVLRLPVDTQSSMLILFDQSLTTKKRYL
jgi:hypothetical protein